MTTRIKQSLKEELRAELADLGTRDIKIDRESSIQGSPATEVRVYVTVKHGNAPVDTEHVFQFAKANSMSSDEMARVIRSYLNSGIDEVMA